jgi:hypothetical protein
VLTKQYTSAKQFITTYNVTEKEITELNNYLTSKKVTNYNLTTNEKGFNIVFKALVGRNLFDKDAYFPILNQNDNAILKAIEVLNKLK